MPGDACRAAHAVGLRYISDTEGWQNPAGALITWCCAVGCFYRPRGCLKQAMLKAHLGVHWAVKQGALQLNAAASAPARAALCGVLQLPIAVLLQVPALHWRQLCNRRKVQVISVSEHAQLRRRRAVTAAYNADGLRGRQQLAVSCMVAGCHSAKQPSWPKEHRHLAV